MFFQKADTDGSGGLSLSEMTEAMSVIENADVSIQKLFKEHFPSFDLDNNNELNLRGKLLNFILETVKNSCYRI